MTTRRSPGRARAAAASLLLLPFLIAGCGGGEEGGGKTAGTNTDRFVGASREIMGTTIEVLLPDDVEAPARAETVFALFRAVDASMSEWKESSPLSRVNRSAGGDPVAVPADLREVIRRALEIGKLTGGAFDITWAALWGVWDFRAPEPRAPDRREIEERLSRIDYRAVEIDAGAGTVRLPREGMKIGLGGIAKGYALDLSAAALRRMGAERFLLSAGGQIYAAGLRDGRPWRVGIRDPRGAPGDYFAFFEASDVSVSTSGDYESYFMIDGVRYHHILDPRTGFPARTVRSATVISPDALTADALSTALVVLGRDKGLDLVESLDGVEAVLIDSSGAIYSTAGVGERLVIRHALLSD